MTATMHRFRVGEQVRWRWRGGPPGLRVGTVDGTLILGDHGTLAYWIVEGDSPRYYVPEDEAITLVRD